MQDLHSPELPAYRNSTLPVEQRVEDLLPRMTVREKLGQLTQHFSGRSAGEVALENYYPVLGAGGLGSFIWALSDPGMRNRLQWESVEKSRLGIPLIFGMDIIHGARTSFPIALGLACAFDPGLFEKAQSVAAREAAAEGIDWIFGPMCDLARDPRWGRVAETCGEDPYLSSLCNAAQVRGMQGEDPSAPDRVAACLKHFAGYSAVTGGRDYNDAEISEWTLRNAHFPAFHAGIRAGALTVMSSFNTLDGIPAVANRRLLTDLLRGEWGFDGFVLSDWHAVKEMVEWGFASDRAEAARLAISAGNDMDMLSDSYLEHLENEISEERIRIGIIDEAVRRVLRVKFRLGLFERPYVDTESCETRVFQPEALALARECVARAAILLKNTGVLPLSPHLKRVALIGPFAADAREMLGCWNEKGLEAEVVTLEEGLRTALGGDVHLEVVKGCSVNTALRTRTLQDGSVVADGEPDDNDLNLDEAVRAAREAEIVIMALGEPAGWTGENASRASLSLTGHQQALFDAVAATGTPVVAVIFSGRPLALPAIWKNAQAVFYAWQPGTQAGHGLADLLTGKVGPSGRLCISVPHDVAQVPIFYNQYRTGRPSSGQYRDVAMEEARFCFGYGLTYTSFVYKNFRIVEGQGGSPAEAVVTICNTGSLEGTEVAQLYIRQLVCTEGARPRQELRGFRRASLQPGEIQEVRFALNNDVLGYVDRSGKWRVENGSYHIWIAPQACTGTPELYNHLIS